MGILPDGYANDLIATAPIGSGPFGIQSHLPFERTTLVRNEAYWDPNLPYLDELHYLNLPEETAQIAALTSGTVDMLYQIDVKNISVLEAEPDVLLQPTESGYHDYIVMHSTTPPFDDLRVRQALKMTVDRDAMRQIVLQNHGVSGNDQPIPPVNPSWGDVTPLPLDIEGAKALLAEAGYSDGLDLTLVIADISPGISDLAVALQEMAKPAGFNITIEHVPVNTFWSEYYMQVPFYILNWYTTASPDVMFNFFYHSNASFNETDWQDARADELIEAAAAEGDPEKRQALYTEVQQIISHNGGTIIPYFRPIYTAMRSNVQDILITPEGYFYPHTAKIVQE